MARRSTGAWRGIGLSCGAVLLVAAAPAARAEDPAMRAALARAADQHAIAKAVLREQTWDAATVARLARWARHERGAATPADVALLQDELARPVSLSVSGAVSLGSYQGGFLYYYLRALAEVRALTAGDDALAGPAAVAAPRSPLGLVTGASSGSINAFIAAVTSCKAPVRAPRASLFWRTWIPVGGDALESNVEVSPDGLLSVVPIDGAVDTVKKAWDVPDWADQTCAVDVGLSATRVRARSVQPLDGVDLWLPKQTEKLMFRLRGAAGAEPELSAFAPPQTDPSRALYLKLFRQLGQGRRPTFDDVTDLLRASSAFSFAFPPHPLSLRARDTGLAERSPFTDGGVFDDRPVGLAVQMQRWRLGAAGGGEATSRTRYLVQDPDEIDWTPYVPAAPVTGPARTTFLGTWLPFLGDFINTAFEIELMDALEREPTLYAGLEIPPRRVPVAGAYLMEFLAFAEEDFRVFDFFTGMVDAWQQLAESSLAFQVLQAASQGPVFDEAPELDCLLAWRAHQLTNTGAPPPEVCAAVGAGAVDPTPRRNLEALVHASAVTRAWSLAPHAETPTEQDVFLGALGTAPTPYVYRQLKYRGAAADAGTVELAIRDVMQDIIERTTFDQEDGLGRFAVGSVGKALANYYVYRPPVWYAAAGLVSDRGFELLGARRLPWNRHRPRPFELRVDGALRVLGIHLAPYDTQPGSGRVAAFTYLGAVHLANELQLPVSNAAQTAVQAHVGVGWAFESLQTWNGPLLWRQGLEVVGGLAVYQRLYLEISYDHFFDDCAWNNRCSHADPYLDDKLPPLVDANWSLRFSLGYRFFVD